MYETLIHMYYFFAMREVQCLSLDLCNTDAYAVWGLYCSHAPYCPFHMVEGLDVAMRGAGGGEGWGRGEGGIRYVVICCCGGEM